MMYQVTTIYIVCLHFERKILTYGSEYGVTRMLRVMKLYVLRVNKTTPNFMVHGESGKLPVAYHIQCKMISFWLRVIYGSENKMVVKMYKVLHQKYTNNLYKSP